MFNLPPYSSLFFLKSPRGLTTACVSPVSDLRVTTLLNSSVSKVGAPNVSSLTLGVVKPETGFGTKIFGKSSDRTVGFHVRWSKAVEPSLSRRRSILSRVQGQPLTVLPPKGQKTLDPKGRLSHRGRDPGPPLSESFLRPTTGGLKVGMGMVTGMRMVMGSGGREWGWGWGWGVG